MRNERNALLKSDPDAKVENIDVDSFCFFIYSTP